MELLGFRYRVVSQLGEGGLGTAFRVLDELSGQERCLKLLGARDRSSAQHLRTEFELLRGLEHPRLARVHDFGALQREGARVPYFTSDVVEGTSLDVAAAGRSAEDVKAMLAGPLQALAFLHDRGICHGDFKPANILVSGSRGTLIDLSCARRFGASGEVSGTPSFIAPEVMRGERIDVRADLFAVGVTLRGLSQASPTPKPWMRLVERLVEARPEDRPSSVREVMDVLGIQTAPAEVAVPCASFRGRAGIVDAFRACLAEPSARCFVVRGEAGSGKSRMLRELKWLAQLSRNAVEGSATSSDGLLRMLSCACAEPLPQGVMGAIRAREMLVARGEPIVFVMDDADLLAAHQLDVLRAFVGALEPADPIVLLLSGDERFELQGSEIIDLQPLDAPTVQAWVEECLGPCPSEIASHVLEVAEGHAGSVARSVELLASGTPASALGAVLLSSGRMSATASLSDKGKDILSLLLVGGIVPSELCAVTSEVSSLITETPRGYSLRRGVDLAALRLCVGEDRERAAHQCLADSISGPDVESTASRVLHLAGAGRSEQARALLLEWAGEDRPLGRCWVRAAEAVARFAPEPAVLRVIQRAGEPRVALGLLTEHDAESRLLAGTCLLELGETGAALERSRGLSTPEAALLESRCHIRLGAHGEAASAAARGLEKESEPLLRAQLHQCAGVAAMYSGELDSATQHLAKAKELADALARKDPRELVRLLSYDAILAFRKGDLRTARDGYDAALKAAQEHGLADQIPRASLNLGTACHQQGELAAALEAYEYGERLARAVGQRDLSLVLAFDLAKLFADMGALDRAEAKASWVTKEADERGARFFLAAARSVIADVALCRGDTEDALEHFTAARDGFAVEGAQREVAEEELELARTCLLSGSSDEAREHLSVAKSWDGLNEAADLRIRAGMIEARLVLADGDPTRARRLLGDAVGRASRSTLPDLQARALAQLADVASAQGLPGEARELLERARELWRKMAAGLPSAASDAFWRRPERIAAHEASRPTRVEAPAVDDRASKVLRLLNTFRKLNSSLETQDVLAMALDEAIELTGAERGFVLLDQGEGESEIAVARNMDRTALDTTDLKFSRSIADQAIRTATAVLTVDARADDRFRENVSVHAMRLRSVIAVPIRSPDGVLGALYLDNRYAAARFDENDTDLLLAFADQVALALRNARLVTSLRKRQEELDTERRRVEELARGQALEIDRLHEEVRLRQAVLEHRYDYSAIVGRAPALRRVFSLLDRVIDSPLNVMITGESGTGKELVARAVHYGSSRKAGPFMGINCAALPATLLESELFGHVRGAFTGADRDRAGLVVAARGGTLFLDELGEMPLDVQAKLLRVLQEKEVRPLGSAESIAVDFRLVCATNRDLRAQVAQGKFREDLFYRVSVVEVPLPSLRERATDIPELVQHFMTRAAEQLGRQPPRIATGAMRLLSRHDWPGNIRELENVVTKAVVLADGNHIQRTDIELGPGPVKRQHTRARGPSKDDAAWIRAALEETGWNAVRAARDLGMPRATLYRRLKDLGLQRPKRP